MAKIIKFERRTAKVANQSNLVDSKTKLVNENFAVAIKLSKQILKAWGARMHQSEIESAVGIALCEAVRKYRPVNGAKFTTYLHYFLKGALSESIGFQISCIDSLKLPDKIDYSASHESSEVIDMNNLRAETDVDREVYIKEIRRGVNKAIAKLSLIEKIVIYRADLLGCKVANLANEMGYSRGYLSEVRSKAERTLRHKLDHFREVA